MALPIVSKFSYTFIHTPEIESVSAGLNFSEAFSGPVGVLSSRMPLSATPGRAICQDPKVFSSLRKAGITL